MTVRGKEDVLSVVRLVKAVKVCKSWLRGCQNKSEGNLLSESTYLNADKLT